MREPVAERRSHSVAGALRLAMFVLLSLSLSGCISSCDPAVVPMPEGYDDLNFNARPRDMVRRGASEFGKRILVWRDGRPIELSPRRGEPDRFRGFYEPCSDKSLCDEVSFNFELSDGDDYILTLVRFGPPLMSASLGRTSLGTLNTRDRCDDYKALARDLWGEPDRVGLLDGRMEIFEINDRYWGATLCSDFAGANLFVGRQKRIEEML